MITVVGDIALDVYLDVATSAGTDEKITAVSGSRSLGGTGANAAAALVRLGSPARLVAAVGRDPVGPWLLEALAATGVDTGWVFAVEGRSTLAVIERWGGKRRVVVDRGVADELDRVAVTEVLADAALVYLSAIPADVARRFLSASAAPVVVGVEARQASEYCALSPELDRSVAVITNAPGADALRAAAAAFRRTSLIVTMGREGATLVAPDASPKRFRAPPAEAVDATGAGDCFSAAVCHFLVGGRPLEECVQLAAIAGALSVTATGAQTAFPTEQAVLRLAHMRPTEPQLRREDDAR